MELEETTADRDHTGHDGAVGEPSVSSSLEHLVAGSQGVITKRIDLALLEGQELLSRALERTVLLGAGMLMAAAAWFAGAGAFVLLVTPDASPTVRLLAFGLLNGTGAIGLVRLAMRDRRPATQVRSNGNRQHDSARRTQAKEENDREQS